MRRPQLKRCLLVVDAYVISKEKKRVKRKMSVKSIRMRRPGAKTAAQAKSLRRGQLKRSLFVVDSSSGVSSSWTPGCSMIEK
jgi:hypothetical protein